jgi:hypothetical protein
MGSTIRIPVYPYVRRYLEVQYGPSLYVFDRNYASTVLRSMLKKFNKQDPSIVRPSQKLNLGATYDITIGRNSLDRLGAYLTNEDIKRFSQAMDLLIRQEMYRWCQHPNATDHVTDFNIRRFIDLYGFSEDDLPFENLKRWYFRERERINKRLNARIEQDYKMILSYASTEDGLPITRCIHSRDDEPSKNWSIPKEFQLIIPFN